ncbi:MAG TPA: 4'-phosphopantetheinyl transferase superfamily protein [Dyella sp.]|uniref:4'-phosphopantetheinyl transferase family protein n=1 Tax=Dyella sp. TaxID=1869338 RepID=UPI002F92C172
MSQPAAATNAFLVATQRALDYAGFAPPSPGATCVLVFDSTLWNTHIASVHGLLNAVEQARAMRFRFERDREPYAVGHAVWRIVLAACLNVPISAVPLVSTASGQPHLPGTRWVTSLSHSGSWVAIAVGEADCIGVDIERSPSQMNLSALMPRFCTPAECVQLSGLPTPLRETRLLALWTRKEALLKAFGTGLNEDPASMAAAENTIVAAPASCGRTAVCHVRDLDLPASLVGALAVPAGAMSHRLYWLDRCSNDVYGCNSAETSIRSN